MARYIPQLIGICDNCGIRLDYNKWSVYNPQSSSLHFCSLECLLEQIQKLKEEIQKEPANE